MSSKLPVLACLVVLVAVPLPAWAARLTSASHPVVVDYSAAEHAGLAAAVLAAAEKSWQRLVVELGYPAPLSTADGGAAKPGAWLKIAATGMGPGAASANWGADVASTSRCDCSSSITVDSATARDAPALESTVFHEMVHTSQDAADCTEAPSAYEGFAIAAVALEFAAVPAVTKQVSGLVAQFQRFPEYPLDYWTMSFRCDDRAPCFPYQLGAGLFPLFLVDRFQPGDPSFLAALTEARAQDGRVTVGPPHPSCSQPNEPNWFEAVDEALEARGSSLEAAFLEFTSWRAIIGSSDDGHHFALGKSLPGPTVAARHPLTTAFDGELEVYELGSRYIELELPSASARWQLSFTGDPASRWASSVLLWKASGGKVVELPLPGVAGGEVELDTSDLTRAVWVVSQLDDGSHDPDAMDYAGKRKFQYLGVPVASVKDDGPDAGTPPVDAPSPTTEPDAPGDKGGGGCAVADKAPRDWPQSQALLASTLGLLALGAMRRRARRNPGGRSARVIRR